jgi:hypothetical protein
MRAALSLLFALLLSPLATTVVHAAQLLAGVAKVDITDRAAGPVNDPSYVKALVLKDGSTTVVLVTVDAVAIGGIGRIGNDYLGKVRAELQRELGIPPASVLLNASHCHSVVRADTDALTVQAVKEAVKNMVLVRAGAGRGREDRIMENRRLKLKDGSELDLRRAYATPRDEDVAGVGPVDAEIGLLRLDRADGRPFALVYNFACHPIHGVPAGGNTADFPGFASKVIEENFGEGVMAFFVQGCAGDINPSLYKATQHPHDAEAYGNLLGLSALRAARAIKTSDASPLRIVREAVSLPRAADYEKRIAAIEAEQARLLKSFKGTSLNFKAFLPLYLQHKLSPDAPAYHLHRYLHEKAIGREDLAKLDAENRANVEAYLQNISAMEQLTRLQVNLALLKRHHPEAVAAKGAALEAELCGVRVGDFVLVTFPGELTVEIGLAVKKRAGANTFVAGYTNGYLFYLPHEAQRTNKGFAQEDCDCLVAIEWRKLFDARVDGVLKKLAAE